MPAPISLPSQLQLAHASSSRSAATSGLSRQRGEFVEIDADREGAYQRGVPVARQIEAGLVGAGFNAHAHGFHEIARVVTQVEAEQIVAEHAVEHLFAPRENAEDLGVGPGDVPELGDDQLRVAVLEHARQQREMVVLDEDERGPIAGFVEDGFGRRAG